MRPSLLSQSIAAGYSIGDAAEFALDSVPTFDPGRLWQC